MTTPAEKTSNGSATFPSAGGEIEDLRRLIDTLPHYLWLKDLSGNILVANQPAIEASGRELERVQGLPTQTVYPRTAESYARSDRQVIETGRPLLGHRDQLPNERGVMRPISVDKYPIVDSDGDLSHLLVVGTDLSEVERQASVIDGQRAKFQTLFNSSPFALLLLDQTDVVRLANPRAERWFGLRPLEGVGERLERFLPGAEVSLRDRRENQSFEVASTHRVTTENGPSRFAKVWFSPVTIEDEPFTLVSIDDISEQKRIEAYLDAATGAGKIDFWHLVYQNDKVVFQPSYMRQLGLEEPWTEFDHWVHHVHPDDAATAVKTYEDFESSDHDYYESTFRLRHVDGHYLWILSRGVRIRDTDGVPTRLVGTHIDITDQRETEETLRRSEAQLRQTNEDLDRFTYIASHDLRAPLRGLSALVGFIREDLSPEALTVVSEHLAAMDGRLERLDHLLTNLLKFSRASRVEQLEGPADVCDLLNELYDDLKPDDEYRMIIDCDAERYQTIPTPLRHILQNLIDNAIKYRGDRGTTIRCTVCGGHPLGTVVVKDDGPGIPPELHEKVFEPFKRGNHRDVGGAGVGLALVRRMILRFGGSIALRSDTNQGAEFTLTFPLEPIPASSGTE